MTLRISLRIHPHGCGTRSPSHLPVPLAGLPGTFRMREDA
jgi:hypothetical protein